MRSIAGLLLVVVISFFAYKFYFTNVQTNASGTPEQIISSVGVKNDLLAIAQAERAYQAEHGAYGSIDDLVAASALSSGGRKRLGYQYDIEITTDDFRVTAHCLASSGCTSYSVDKTMEVQPLQ
jgi:hypothetical protein